jgi:hypothetical protein
MIPARHRGFETPDTPASGVADRRLNGADRTTQDDAKQREVSASSDVVEAALARALGEASAAGRFDVVAQLARELEARRHSRTGNIVALDPAKRRGEGR